LSLTNAEQIKVKQLLRVPVDRVGDLAGILSGVTDADVLAAVRDGLLRWDEVKAARNPVGAGMTRADVVEWDSEAKCEALRHLEGQIRGDVAIAIGWELDLVSFDGGIWF
jgi:hypothetical protein